MQKSKRPSYLDMSEVMMDGVKNDHTRFRHKQDELDEKAEKLAESCKGEVIALIDLVNGLFDDFTDASKKRIIGFVQTYYNGGSNGTSS